MPRRWDAGPDKFEEDTLRPRPLWIRLIVEFAGTFVLVTVAAGSGWSRSLRQAAGRSAGPLQ